MLLNQQQDTGLDTRVRMPNSLIQLRRFIDESNKDILKAKNAKRKGESLTLQEAKHLDYLLSLIPEEATSLTSVEFEVADYWKACGIAPNSGRYFNISAEVLQRLHNHNGYVKLINPQTKEEEIKLVGFIKDVTFSKSGRRCRVEFDKTTAPLLLSMSSYYSRPLRSEKLQLQCMYGHALFDLLCSYEYLQLPQRYEAKMLAEQLDAIDRYQSGDFRKKVIDKALKDINSTSKEIQITYEVIRKGNVITHYEFQIHRHSGICASVGEEASEAATTEEQTPVMRAIDVIRQKINYPHLLAVLQSKPVTDASLLDAIVDTIHSVKTATEEYIKIRKKDIPTQEVQQKYEQLTEEHIELVIDKLCDKLHDGEYADIGNLHGYLRTTLYCVVADLSFEKAKSAMRNAPRKKTNPAGRELDEEDIAAIKRMLEEE